MKRPFLFLGILSLLLSSIVLFCQIKYLLFITLGLFVLLIILFAVSYKPLHNNSNFYVMAIVAALLLISAFFSIQYVYIPTARVVGTTGTLDAVVINEPESNGSQTIYTLKGEYSRLRSSFKCQTAVYGRPFDIGDRVKLEISCDSLDEKYAKGFMAEGIFASVNIDSVIEIQKDYSFFYTRLGRLRSYIKNTILKVADGDIGGTLIAILTGDRSFMSDFLYGNSKICGVTHILVVSGLHISILSSAVLWVFGKIKLGKRKSFCIIFILLMLIIAICNFHTSAIRSVIMSLILLSGPLVGRKSDILNSLGFAVSLIVVFNPFVAGSVGFLLSVFATFGVIYLPPMLIYLIEPIREKVPLRLISSGVLNTLIVSLSATVCILPITIYYFGYFSLISPIVNLLISLAVEAALITVAAGVIISPIPFLGLIYYPIIYLAGLFAKYIIIVINFFAEFKFLVVDVNPYYANLCFIICAAIILTVNILYLKRKKERKAHDVTRRENT